MDFSNYLLESKAPEGKNAELGQVNNCMSGICDLSQVPKGTTAISLTTPLKKSKLFYSNWNALAQTDSIESVYITDLDEGRVSSLAALPNLRYLNISFNKQEILPAISSLDSLEVLVLYSIRKAPDLKFLAGLPSLKTLYIQEFRHLSDLTPLEALPQLQELHINLFPISGGYIGEKIKSLQPLSTMKRLVYLCLNIQMENKNYDCTPLLTLKNLKCLYLRNAFYRHGQDQILKMAFAKLMKSDWL